MGGTSVDYGEHPWAVAILRLLPQGKAYVCTGTLISKKHVITAAHCFLKQIPDGLHCMPENAHSETEAMNLYAVGYGSNCLVGSLKDKCSGSPPMKTARISRLQYGPYFERECIGGGDFALIELDTEITDTANYACLPFTQKLPEKMEFFHSIGWGSNPAAKLGIMNNLQKLTTYVHFNSEMCREKWPMITDDMFCTPEVNNANTCAGDSGGGTFTKSIDGRWVILGILSYGVKCEDLLMKRVQPIAEAHTNVTFYANHINDFTDCIFC